MHRENLRSKHPPERRAAPTNSNAFPEQNSKVHAIDDIIATEISGWLFGSAFKFVELILVDAVPSSTDTPPVEALAGTGVDNGPIDPDPPEALSPKTPFCVFESELASCHAGMLGRPKLGRAGAGDVEEGKLGPRLRRRAFSDLSSCCNSARELL